jgi:glycosyltransferase involved in cell wall biosynthesis
VANCGGVIVGDWRLDQVTIILPTRNEENNIGAFCRSLPQSVWLIVVDDSDDRTPDLVRRDRPERTRIVCEQSNVVEARQIGARLAQTEWLVFADADVVFAPDYWEHLMCALTRDAGTGRGCDVLYGTKLSRDDYQGYYRRFRWGQGFSHWLGIPAASGSNLVIRRGVFWASGGFDLGLTVNEDSEIAWRLKREGYTVCFDRELIVYARDHRRLRQGTLRKNAHSIVRCLLLYAGLMPERWRSRDWGYWSSGRGGDAGDT